MKKTIKIFLPVLMILFSFVFAMNATTVYSINTDSNSLFTSNTSSINFNQALPSYIQNLSWGGKNYNNSDITAVKIESDGISKFSSVKYNRIIDLSNAKKTDSLFDFIITPAKCQEYSDSVSDITSKMYDFRYFNIKLTDIYDDENYIKIDFERRQDFKYLSSIRVATKEQESCGYVASSQAMRQSPYGTPLSSSFIGSPATQSGEYRVMSTVLDYAEKTVYASPDNSNKQTVVKDLDNLDHMLKNDNLWKGFTTGEVYLSFDFASISESAKATIYLFSLNGQSLVGEKIIDDSAPKIFLDESEIESEKLPYAEIGKQYKLFNVRAYDNFDGKIDATKINAKVFYNKSECLILNNSFTPKNVGEYTISYFVLDTSQNEGILEIKINSEFKLFDIEINFKDEDMKESYYIGEKIKTPNNLTILGGSGAYKTQKYLIYNNTKEILSVEGDYFILNNQGYYTLVYRVEDYLQNVKYKKFLIKGKSRITPLVLLPTMPRALVKGAKFCFPEFSALDYNTFDGMAVEARKYYLVSHDNWLTQEKYNQLDIIDTKKIDSIEYKICAVNLSNSSHKFESEKGKISIYEPNSIGDYFYKEENAVLKYCENKPMYHIAKDTELQFVNPINLKNFNFDFSIPEGKANFDIVNLTFCDEFISNKKCVIGISKKDESSCLVSINNKIVSELSAPSGASAQYNVVISNNNIYINSAYIGILSNEESEVSINKGYFSIGFEGVTQGSEFTFTRLNNQTYVGLFNEGEQFDLTPPTILLLQDIKKIYYVGDKIVAPMALACDVLDSSVTLKVTVKQKDKTIYESFSMKDNLIINADEPSEYSIQYSALDSKNNLSVLNYTIKVYNKNAPSLVIEGNIEDSVKVNSTIKLPIVRAYDYFNNEIKCSVFILKPNGVMEKCSDKFVFDSEGLYILRYFCIDDFGAYKIQNFEIRVKG